jgi:hypothetical protein
VYKSKHPHDSRTGSALIARAIGLSRETRARIARAQQRRKREV